MPKWNVEVYFSAYKTVEVEADSWHEARDQGLEMVEDPDEEDFSVDEVECYRVLEGEEWNENMRNTRLLYPLLEDEFEMEEEEE